MESYGLICALTGERGSGKSTVCAGVAGEVSRRGLVVAGIVTERVRHDKDSGRRVRDLASGQTRPLGMRGSSGNAATSGGLDASPRLAGGRDYDPEAFDWAQDVLSRSTPCDLLVVDELGPLELLQGRGWVKALDVLRSGDFHAALVVCRPALLGELEDRLGEAPGAVFEVTAENGHVLAQTIASRLFGGVSQHR